MSRLEHMDTLCLLCRFARARGNGWIFSYGQRANYLPRSVP